MFQSMDHFEIPEIEVFVEMSLSPINLDNVWLKHVANLAASV